MPKEPENLGLEGERAAEEAVRELVKENPLLFVGYLRAKSSDRLDSEGIDIMVFVRGGFALPLQIRTTRKKIRRFNKIHPLVRFVLVIKKQLHHNNALDRNTPLYRGTLDYIKRKVQDFTRRAIRDIVPHK